MRHRFSIEVPIGIPKDLYIAKVVRHNLRKQEKINEYNLRKQEKNIFNKQNIEFLHIYEEEDL